MQTISAARDELVSDSSYVGMDFCRAYTAAIDQYLSELFGKAIKKASSRLEIEGKDIALIALGGYGRGEMSPQSDLDVQLIYGNDYRLDVSAIATELWYPLWNDKLKLGHSIGSFNDITLLARHELNTATTLLSARHIAGDSKLTQRLRQRAHKIWYSQAGQWLGELLQDAQKRHRQFGSVAYMLEPNLKQGAGGLRDAQLMCWGLSALLRQPAFGADPAAKSGSQVDATSKADAISKADATSNGSANLADLPDYSVGSGIFSGDAEIRDAYRMLLAARVELHRAAGKSEDQLLFCYQDEIAEAAGYQDARQFMTEISFSARLLSWRLTELAIHFKAMGQTFDSLAFKLLRRTKAQRKFSTQELDWSPLGAMAETDLPAAKALDDWTRQHIELAQIVSGLSAAGSEADEASAGLEGRSLVVRISQDAPIDNLTILRLATAAARFNALIDRETLTRLKQQAPPMPKPWPDRARELLVELLLFGRAAVQVIEALDIAELFTKLVPEWEPCRCLSQQNVYHRFTVDRHLCEAAAEASQLTHRVERPDLLVVGALLHDIGKGYPGDHTEVGIPLVGQIAERMGFPAEDVAVLQLLVREHLLLPDVATRRDFSDISVLANVAQKVGTVETLHLLAALTEADSIATSSHAWSPWKKGLLEDLVRRTEHYLTDGIVAAVEESSVPTQHHKKLMQAGESMLHASGETVTVISPDHSGQFSEVAGVLTLNGLFIREGVGHVENGMALCHFLVEPTFEGEINWARIEPQIEAALAGRLALEARLAKRTFTPQPTAGAPMIEQNYVKFDNDSSQTCTVIEIGATDCFGLLRYLSLAMTHMRLEIRSVKTQTLGGSVVDSFYVQSSTGSKITEPATQNEIELAIEHAIELSQAG